MESRAQFVHQFILSKANNLLANHHYFSKASEDQCTNCAYMHTCMQTQACLLQAYPARLCTMMLETGESSEKGQLVKLLPCPLPLCM